MSNWATCFNWMMVNEDGAPPYRYKQVNDAPDVYQTDSNGTPILDGNGARVRTGSYAISGINSHSYPIQFARIAQIPQEQREPFIENFYLIEFWNKWYNQIISDEIAKRVFDEAVNAGPGTAVKILQKALGIQDDGLWGPLTVEKTNTSSPSLVQDFISARCQHYEDIAKEHPAEAKYLDQWLVRARK